MMTCRELTDFLSDYVSGSLPRPVHRRFRVHLWMCRNCRTFVAQFRDTVTAGARAYEDQPRSPMPEELVQAIMRAVEDSSTQNGR